MRDREERTEKDVTGRGGERRGTQHRDVSVDTGRGRAGDGAHPCPRGSSLSRLGKNMLLGTVSNSDIDLEASFFPILSLRSI